ncbi:MAG: group II intron reverse transcriptase/maturase [Planctomycetales bacterium]|nr:group II intron reverse transcriptase/maturase [Planctomycetales bacterium]
MKNKEESSIDSTRGNFWSETPQSSSGDVTDETLGSLSRPGRTATAPIEQPALSDTPESLLETALSEANLEQARKNVKANRGAPGPDGITLREFPDWFRPRWPTIRQQLLDGTYRPGPVRRKSIDKPDGSGKRLLGIPNVLDRLIQQAIVQVLTPVFDPKFSESSFGFRPKRSAHGAAKQVQRIIRRGYRYCVDMDLSKFFDRVQHDILMSRVARKVHDRRLLRLIGNYLRAGVMVEGILQPTEEGTPQGGPASPLLANILLDDLDKELERRGLRFVRYADDFVIFTKSLRSAERVKASITRFLTSELRLVVNQEKSRIVASDEVEYLGFAFRGSRATIQVANKAIQKFKHRIRELTGRSRGISMEERLQRLNRYLRGWTGYFALASQLKLFDRFDQWIRRRIRMCFCKRWRYPRTRRRELIALGVPRRQATRHARTRKGPWHMAKSIATGVGMTNDWLKQLGLLSLKSLWATLAPTRRTA